MRSLLKFRLLLWKNFLIQKRKPFVTFLEIGLPTFFALILMLLRLRVHSTPHPNVSTWNKCPYQQMSAELHTKILGYTPQNNVTDRLMNHVSDMLHIEISKCY